MKDWLTIAREALEERDEQVTLTLPARLVDRARDMAAATPGLTLDRVVTWAIQDALNAAIMARGGQAFPKREQAPTDAG